MYINYQRLRYVNIFFSLIGVSCVVGSTLESMATAVEEAAVVIICMSSSYMKSKDCKMG